MLSDEEKEAIERLTKKMEYYKNKPLDTHVWLTLDEHYVRTILNLIEKQSKEIEELKQIKCKLDEKNIPIETLLAEFERLEDLEDDLTTVYLNGVYDGEKKVEDKIKAKIEEIKQRREKDGECELALHGFQREAKIEVLQSLLEEE